MPRALFLLARQQELPILAALQEQVEEWMGRNSKNEMRRWLFVPRRLLILQFGKVHELHQGKARVSNYASLNLGVESEQQR